MVACEVRPGISAKRTAAFGAGLTAPANTGAKVSAATGRDKIDMDGFLSLDPWNSLRGGRRVNSENAF